MLLSVVVIIYNEEEYLETCVKSIIAQSKKDIEIILVDDGSTDRSGGICDFFQSQDKRVKVIHQTNQGMIRARRNGVYNATGEYIAFVDADDFVETDSFILGESYMKHSVDMICFNYYIYAYGSVQEREQIFREGFYERKAIESEIYPRMIWDERQRRYGMEPSLCSKIIKKQYLEKCYAQMENYTFNIGEDRAVVYPILKDVSSLQILQKSYYNYRYRPVGENASYLVKDSYLDDLHSLYSYLKGIFSSEDTILRQLELSYIDLAELRRLVYGKLKKDIDFVFPFDQIDKNERIVVYGAGAVGQTYMQQLEKLNYCEVVLWCDKNWSNYNREEIKPVSEIKDADYDKIVIAASKENLIFDIRADLLEMGVEKEKIV